MNDVIEWLDGRRTLVKNLNVEKDVTEVHHRNAQHLLQDCLSVTPTKYFANFMKIDEMNAEHYDCKLLEHFP